MIPGHTSEVGRFAIGSTRNRANQGWLVGIVKRRRGMKEKIAALCTSLSAERSLESKPDLIESKNGSTICLRIISDEQHFPANSFCW